MKRAIDGRTIGLAGSLILVAAFLFSFVRGLGWPTRSGADEPAGNAGTSLYPDEDRRGRIDVRNATSRPGLAADVTGRLRDAGFDVVYFGNADVVPDSSAVIDNIGNASIARAVADELGISRILTRIDSTLYLDATVILGVDFELPGR